jgi:GT2 family glycosyltransferase
MFWSLCFGISNTDYARIGRFDEKFIGYGGEDTDFAFKARNKKIPFYICDATVFHQPHTLHEPPLQHFVAIVMNANYFFRKWKKWPMGNYLRQFAELNLIEWHPDSKLITILRFPNEAEVVSTKIVDAPFL